MANSDISKIKLPNNDELTIKDGQAVKAIERSGTTFTATRRDGTTFTFTQQDNNTTYTFATGDNNGQIKVTPSGGTAQNVSVKGLGAAAYKGTTTSVTSGSSDLVTSGAVYTAIDNLPEPMVFKGSLGTGGTITALPIDGTAQIGDTYKVITAGTYASQPAKVGDTFICYTKTSSENTWVYIPSGDEPSGTVTSVGISNGGGLSVSGSPITSSGTITISHADTSSQASVNNSGRTYIQDITLDTYGHVTGITSATETVVNTDRYVNSAAFAHDSTNDNVKMTLTRAGSDTATVTANIPKVSSSSSGVVPKGATVSSQSQTTKFLREDGTWAAPSYTTNTNTTYILSVGTGDDANKIVLTPSSGTANKITVPYATSAGTATKAFQLTNQSKVGDTNKPVYFTADGRPVAISYTIEKSVPSGAVFTDTTYTLSADTTNNKIKLTPSSGVVQSIIVPYATRADSATSAGKLSATDRGSSTNPIYFSNGIPVACTYSLNKTVPANAVFTDANVSITNTDFGWGYLTWYTAKSGTGGLKVNADDGLKYLIHSGTESNVGSSGLFIGNGIAEGDVGNQKGQITIYSSGSGYSALVMDATDESRTHKLPDVSGTISVFTTSPTSGQVVVSDGTAGGLKTTGYTIAKSVPSDAVFTDTNNAVTQTATSTNANYEVLFSNTADNTTRTEATRKSNAFIFNPTTGLKLGVSSQSAFPTLGIDVHDVRSVNFTPGALDRGANFFFSNNTMPNTNWWAGLHVKGWTGAYAAWEIVGSAHNNDSRTTPLYVRTSNLASTWGSWRKIYDTSNPPTKSEVGLGNVDNTADANKRVSYATTSGTANTAKAVLTDGGDVIMGTTGSTSDDSGDIVWRYGNGNEKARLWTADTYTAKSGLYYRVYKKDGTSLYNGTIPLADGTGAAGTWNISITGLADSATSATTAAKLSANAGSATNPVYFTGGVPTACTYSLNKTVPADAVFTDHTYNFSGTTFYSGNSGTAEHNCNNATKNGVYYYTSNGAATSIGASTNDGALYVQAYSDSWVGQICQDYRNGNLFTRGKNNGTWTDWRKVMYSNDTYSGTLTKSQVTTALGYTPPTSDTNNAVTQTATTTSANYELLFSATADNTTRTEGARKTDSLKYNPSTKELTLDGTMILNGYSRSTSTDPCPSLILKANNIDTDTAVTARTYSNSEINVHDKDGDRLGFVNWFKDADGSIGFAMSAQNKSAGGGNYYNTLEMRVDKTGNRAYSISDAKAFRTAINTTTCSFTKSISSLAGATIVRRGNVVTLEFGHQITKAGSYTNIGTVSPAPIETLHFVVNCGSSWQLARINTAGVVSFNNALSVAANAYLIGSCTYITAD